MHEHLRERDRVRTRERSVCFVVCLLFLLRAWQCLGSSAAVLLPVRTTAHIHLHTHTLAAVCGALLSALSTLVIESKTAVLFHAYDLVFNYIIILQ